MAGGEGGMKYPSRAYKTLGTVIPSFRNEADRKKWECLNPSIAKSFWYANFVLYLELEDLKSAIMEAMPCRLQRITRLIFR